MPSKEINLGIIDLSKMDDTQNWVLFHFLRERAAALSGSGFVEALVDSKAKNPYEIVLETDQGKVKYTFQLSKDILIRETASEPLEYRYQELEDQDDKKNVIGQGTFGRVILSKATLAEDLDINFVNTHNERLVYKTTHPRIDKIQRRAKTPKKKHEKSITNEYVLTQLAPHTHVKKPIFLEDKKNNSFFIAHTLLRHFKNFDLSQITFEKNYAINTLDEVIELSTLLCLALDEQIHAYGTIHRDLKPENVMVTDDFINPKIIDLGYGLGRNAQGKFIGFNPLKKPTGTWLYASPEQASVEAVTIKTDIYSWTIVLAELWEIANIRDAEANPLKMAEIERRHKQDKNLRPIDLDMKKYISKGFFQQLDPNHVQQIFDLFHRGTDFDPDKRPDAQGMADVFERIRIERKCKAESLDTKRENAMWASNRAAREVRREIISAQIAAPSVKSSIELIKGKLDVLAESKHLDCDEFLMRLGIKALNHLKDKKSIFEKMDQIENTSVVNLKKLNELFDKVKQDLQGAFASPKTKDQMVRLHNKLKREINKYSNKAADLDDIHTLNTRIDRALPDYQKLFEKLSLKNELEEFFKTQPGKIAQEDAKFIEICADERKHPAPLDRSEDFLRTVLKGTKGAKDDSEAIDIITKNKINCLIELYAINFKASPDLSRDFEIYAKTNVKSLPKSDQISRNDLIILQIKDAKQFILIKAQLVKTFLAEMNQAKSNSSILENICSQIDVAATADELYFYITNGITELKNANTKTLTKLFNNPPFKTAIEALQRAQTKLEPMVEKLGMFSKPNNS